MQRKKQTIILLDSNERIITNIEQKLQRWKLQRWKEYIEELFADERKAEYIMLNQEETDPDITKAEVIHALKAIKDGKKSWTRRIDE